LIQQFDMALEEGDAVKALTEQWKLDGSADGRIFFERSMQTASFLVFEIILQDPRNPAAWKTK